MYYYNKQIGIYQGDKVLDSDIELTEAQFNKYNGKKVTYENSTFIIDLDEEKLKKSNEIKSACTAYNPVSLDISLNGETKTIVFNGGDESANSIKGGIDLANELGETTVTLWDYNNKLHSGISFEIALSISKAIAKKWRDDMYKRQTLLNDIKQCTTIEQLNQISW